MFQICHSAQLLELDFTTVFTVCEFYLSQGHLSQGLQKFSSCFSLIELHKL